MFAVVDAKDAVPDLLAAGANVNAKDKVEGVTALTIACTPRRNLQVVKALVNHDTRRVRPLKQAGAR